MRPIAFVCIVLMATWLASCSKSQFTQPVPVALVLELDRSYAVNGTLEPERLTLRPISFIVEGERSAADDITFTRDLTGTQWELSSPAAVEMDLPQGVYEYLRISFNFLGDPAFEADIADEIDEWWEEVQQGGDGEEELYEIVEQFEDDARPALWLEADFSHPSRGDVDVYFVIPNAWVLEVLATRTGSVTLTTGENTQSLISFAVAKWLANVSEAALEQAYYAEEDDDVILFIHPKVNTSLYTLIIDQLENAQNWEVL